MVTSTVKVTSDKLKAAFILLVTCALLLVTPIPALAHAVVKPSTAGVGSFTDFSLGIPSEKDANTISVKLMMPSGLQNISPIVKPGWQINVKQSPDPSGAKDDDGNPAMITSEIDWTGGVVPAHQKDFFMFSAQVPSQETELDWKVEQTYSDGSTITWDKNATDQPKDQNGNPNYSQFGPYSKTMVINDLKPTPAPGVSSNSSSGNVAWAALALAVVSLGLQFRNKA